MLIRFANTNDSAALLHIYGQYIGTPITCECTIPTVDEFAERVEGVVEFYPYLVCEDEGRVIGYAYAHRHTEREIYRWNAELSVYLDRSVVSKGLGTRFYSILVDILKLQGIRNIYAAVNLPNVKSEALHKSLGFRTVGVYRNAGYKGGEWHDVVWFEKAIAPYGIDPQPPIPVGAIPPEQLQAIIESY